jgi:hypothetical protein
MPARRSKDATGTAATPEPKPLPLSEFCRFEIVEVDRPELKNAPYNPRKILPSARDSLRRILKKHGLVEPPVWNARTGNVVGGHQRLSVLDGLHRTHRYRLRVAKIDVSEAEERELNLALNNPSAQGDWDLPKLEGLLRAPDIDLEGAGFNLADVYRVFGFAPLADQSDKLKELAESFAANKEQRKQRQARSEARDSPDYFWVVVFADRAARDQAAALLGLPEDQYQDGREVARLILEGLKGNGTEAGPQDEVEQGT